MADLEAEVKRLHIIIESQKNIIELSKYSKIGSMNELLEGRQTEYEKLHYLLENNSSTQDIENQIEALNIRHGSYGKEQKLLMNSFFKNVIDNILPNYAKYLLHASTDSEEQKSDSKLEMSKKLSKYQLHEMMVNEDLG